MVVKAYYQERMGGISYLKLFILLQVSCFVGGKRIFTYDGLKTYLIAETSRDISVDQGSSAFVNKSHLNILRNDSLICRLEVVMDPICLRFGNISTKAFSCDMNAERIVYDHYGSLISDEDCIKLKLFVFFKDKTLQEVRNVILF